jgi:DNA-binding response OmpR family regulator
MHVPTEHEMPGMTDTVLLVENDHGLTTPLGHTLEREGYDVAWAGNGKEVFDVVDDNPVDCVIFDARLPDMDGLELCRALRESGFDGGIMMVTQKAGELDAVVGVDCGADDFVRGPYGLAELLARLRAVLRRSRSSSPAIVTEAKSPLRVDVDGRRAFAGDAELQLTNKEFGVLAVLTAHRDKVVGRHRLMSEVWDQNWYGSTKTLDVTMGRLRNKLIEAGLPDRIIAVRGVGFRLELMRELD